MRDIEKEILVTIVRVRPKPATWNLVQVSHVMTGPRHLLLTQTISRLLLQSGKAGLCVHRGLNCAPTPALGGSSLQSRNYFTMWKLFPKATNQSSYSRICLTMFLASNCTSCFNLMIGKTNFFSFYSHIKVNTGTFCVLQKWMMHSPTPWLPAWQASHCAAVDVSWESSNSVYFWCCPWTGLPMELGLSTLLAHGWIPICLPESLHLFSYLQAPWTLPFWIFVETSLHTCDC